MDYVTAICAVRGVTLDQGVNPGMQKRIILGHFGTQATNGRLAKECDADFLFNDKFLRTMKRRNVAGQPRRFCGW